MRAIQVVLAAICLTLVGAAPAVAGGWAVTTLDPLPTEVHAGTTYRVGYTIRQHGTHPITVDSSEIRITDPATGTTHRFSGVPDGPEGHYVAEVSFPGAGEWEWEVTQGPFAAQPLGTVSVAAAAHPAAEEVSGLAGAVRAAMPIAAIIAAAVLVLQVVAYLRRRPAATPDAG